MSYLCTEGAVVHEQHIKILHVVNKEFLQSVGEEELSGCV